MNKGSLIKNISWYAGGGAIVITNYVIRGHMAVYRSLAGKLGLAGQDPVPGRKRKTTKKKQNIIVTVSTPPSQPAIKPVSPSDVDITEEFDDDDESMELFPEEFPVYEEEKPAMALDDYVNGDHNETDDYDGYEDEDSEYSDY